MNWEYVILHHTANNKSFEQIRRDHIARGWVDIGYNYVVDQLGEIHKGRSLEIPGAHCRDYGMNKKAIGVAVIGNFEEQRMTGAQKAGLIRIVSQLISKHKIIVDKVKKHNDYSNTACPGKYFPFNEIKEELKNMTEFKDLHKCMYPDLMIEANKIGLISGVKKADGIYLEPDRPITREESVLIDLRQHKIVSNITLIPELIKRHLPSIVRIWTGSGIGSGSYIAPNIILTNYHVVDENKEVTIDSVKQQAFKGKVIKRGSLILEDGEDLALIEVSVKGTPLKMTDEIVQGELCLVMGNPAGEWHSVSAGIVTRFGGSFMQTDALVNPGNSGGAVINNKGELIGVPDWKFTAQAFDNHNYCIMIHKVKEFIKGVL